MDRSSPPRDGVKHVTSGGVPVEYTATIPHRSFALTAAVGGQLLQPSSAILALDLRWTTRRYPVELGGELGLRGGLAARAWAGRALLVTHVPVIRWLNVGAGVGVDVGTATAAAASVGIWLGPSRIRAVSRFDLAYAGDRSQLLVTAGIDVRF